MKRIVLGLLVVIAVALSATPAQAHGRGHRPPGWHGRHHAGYGPWYGPGPGCYPPPRAYYRPVPVAVAPVYPVYPAYPPPRQGFSYFSPGFSFSVGR